MSELSLTQIQQGDLIGRGICGEVYAVTGVEENCVVKRFNSMSIDRHFMAQNTNRLRAMPSEDGIVRVFDSQFDKPPYSIIMSRIDGPDLGEIHGLKEAAGWRLIRRLSESLGHAHKYGAYHGHLHPGNVLLEEGGVDPNPIITDFGTGLVGEIHHIDLGETLYFCAPEQLMPDGSDWTDGAIQKWDVYSFGLIAYRLINERLPRGLKYLKQRDKEVGSSGGRPVPVDSGAYLSAIYDEQAISWGMSLGLSRKFKLFREIVERCLSLNPDDRPVDMREVRNLFRALDHQFALEDAEARVMRERRKQKTKLISARMLAACLGVSFLAASFYLIDYLKKSYFFQNKVTQLDQVVVSQQAHIEHLDDRWAETVTDLKSSREAADSFFQKMAAGDNAGGSGVATMGKQDLEKSRRYYLSTLEDVEKGGETALERARALHSLAHIENRLGVRKMALAHFREAISEFAKLVDGDESDKETAYDVHMRMGDSYENIVALLDDPINLEALNCLQNAVEHFDRTIEIRPEENELVTRLAGTSFMLGQAYDAHQRYGDAIDAYSRSAEFAQALRENDPANPEPLTELIGKLQYQAAHSLRLAGRIDESIDAHIAGMETMEELRHVNGFTPVQSIQMASSFIELGELFASKEASTEELDQLYNESLRLLTPLNRGNPGDVEVAILLCRGLSHLGVLERDEGQWSAGYRLSVRGVETLKDALDIESSHTWGMLVLAEARIEHIRFFDHEDDTALKIALLGIETAEQAKGLLKTDESVREPLLSQLRTRLGEIFNSYGHICEELGEGEVAKRCFEHASIQVSSTDSPSEILVQ